MGFMSFIGAKILLLRSCNAPFFVVEHIENAQIQRKQITMKQENNINFFPSFLRSFVRSSIQFAKNHFWNFVYCALFLLLPSFFISFDGIILAACNDFIAESKRETLFHFMLRLAKMKKKENEIQCHDTHHPKQVTQIELTKSLAKDPNKHDIAFSLFKA